MNVKVLNGIVTHTSVTLAGGQTGKPSADSNVFLTNWEPSKAEIAKSQASVQEAQRLGQEIDTRIKAMQALVAAQDAESEQQRKVRLAKRLPEALCKAAEIKERVRQNQEREKQQAKRRREYNKKARKARQQ
jgi:serine phosphatase RsbU (regulator of sigma subunit)